MSSPQVSVESSLLMWALAALVVWMAAHVMLGWIRQAQEEWEWDFARWRQVIIAGATFGSALSVAIPLGLAGEALSFPIGYEPRAALALWLGTVFIVIVLALVPVWREESVSAAGAGVLLGLLMTGLQVAWIFAVGFRPGIQWDFAFIAAAALVSALGNATAMSIAFPFGERARSYNYSWRIAAAGLIGLAFLAGYALLLFAADLPTQIGSVYRYELPGHMISLLGGGLAPITLLLMVMDLESRRRQRRRRARARRRGESTLSGVDTLDSRFAPSELARYRHASSLPGALQPGTTDSSPATLGAPAAPAAAAAQGEVPKPSH